MRVMSFAKVMGTVGVTLMLAVFAAGAVGLQARENSQAQRGVQEPFKGITTDGTLVPDLFPISATGVSTAPMRDATVAFLQALSEEQRGKASFDINANEWRSWNNVHRATRQGVSFLEMTEPQREKALAMLGASLSPQGLAKSRAVMRLNHTVAELTNNFTEYGEHLYYLTVMGTPSDREPWGWQLEGHHLIVNYFVLGDQVVMTPTFMGSEPTVATEGKYAGTTVLKEEEAHALALMASLDSSQRAAAVASSAKTGNNALTQAFNDNNTIPYAGLNVSRMNAAQQRLFFELVAEFVDNMDAGHARVKMDEVRKHVANTWLYWVGETSASSVFYFRIHSPVILIEFDHQNPVALGGPRVPGKNHVHTVVRTPNGNDYGKDLLRQHYLRHQNDPTHVHTVPLPVRR